MRTKTRRLQNVFYRACSLLITGYGDCEATFTAEIRTRQAHRGCGSVWAPRAQTRVSQSAGRGAYVANELSETIVCGARSNHAHPAFACLGFFKETCLDRFFALAERVAQWRESPSLSSSRSFATPAARATSSILNSADMSTSVLPSEPQGRARIIRTHVSSSAGTPCSKKRPIRRMFAESSVRADATATAARWPSMACGCLRGALFTSGLIGAQGNLPQQYVHWFAMRRKGETCPEPQAWATSACSG